ncbi:glycosyltransferase [Maridesulfovibrio sp. FT414]|uniref:glycosyltransferase n=1 Tax=Maridesulfovibrio sp. FT414 TaxID=2979469 RepID=UPI003D80588B
MLNRTVIHHSALAKSGGAARIAQLLVEGLKGEGVDVRHSFEASENPGDELLSPQETACSIPDNAIVHLHSSADPALFLGALPASVQVFVTLHDTRMITGGCINPLDCPHFELECRNPCPRNYPDSENVRRRIISALLERRVVLVSPSRWLARLVAKAHARLSAKVIPNGIPWPDTLGDRSGARRAMGLHPASKAVLFVAHGGSNAVYKSGPQWAEYWDMIKSAVPEAVAFAIGGDSHSRDGDFISVPYVGREMLDRFMLAADVLAYPTLADNHPLIILEAMSNGLVPVSYNVGGVSEQIISGENGILIAPYEKKDLADTVIALLKNRHLAEKLGENGFLRGKIRFSCARMLNDYIRLYKRHS